MNAEKDYYTILGVRPDADQESIEEAYERLSRELQPDLSEPPSDPARMAELDEAFDTLDDPARRAEYDNARRLLQAAAPVGGAAASEAAAAPSRPRDLTLPIAIGLILSGIAVLAAGAFLLVSGLTDDDGGSFVTTPSGLRYRDTEVGEGPEAEAGKVATVHYTGLLTESGKEFDSSEDRGPFAFLLGATPTQVIEGWDEGVAGMKVGGSRRLIIPPELAYGEQGAGAGIIPPNATLTFDIRLIGVHDAPPPETPPEVEGDELDLGDGLTAIEIAEGSGDEATTGRRVAVHYSGWLADGGKLFDSSLGLPQTPERAAKPPQVFTVSVGASEVIRGWDLGLVGMKEGGKRRLLVPALLAYGDQGAPPTIPGNADLIFDIELVEIVE